MKMLILDSITKKVVNAIEVDNEIPLAEGLEYAPQHDGDIGDTWDGAEWIERDHPLDPPEIFRLRLAKQARAMRDELLTSCDFTQLDDSPRNKIAWKTYRQLLRDIPDQAGFPENIDWPIQPND